MKDGIDSTAQKGDSRLRSYDFIELREFGWSSILAFVSECKKDISTEVVYTAMSTRLAAPAAAAGGHHAVLYSIAGRVPPLARITPVRV